MKEEISALQAVKEKLKSRVSELEDELKKTKDALEKEKQKGGAEGGEEANVRLSNVVSAQFSGKFNDQCPSSK